MRTTVAACRRSPDEAETTDRLLAAPPALAITGAPDGSVICGRRRDQPTGGVRLKVVGFIPAMKASPEEMESHITPVSKHLGVTSGLARMELASVQRDEVDGKNAKPAGYTLGKGCLCDQLKCGCTDVTDTAEFVLLDIGNWREYEGEEGVNIAALDDAICGGDPKSWKWILKQLGIHHLQLRRYLFCIEPRVVATAEPVEGTIAIDLVQAVGATQSQSLGWISPPGVSLSIHAPASKPAPWEAAEALAVCTDVCSGLVEECPLPHKPSDAFSSIGAIVQVCAVALKSSTMGELKSAHQKVVRRGVPGILITSGKEKVRVPSWIYASVCVAQLMVRPNVFDPELGISLRGSVSALKRLAVILCEDAIHEDGADGTELEALLASGLLCQLNVDYHPCERIVEMAMMTTARAVWSRHAVEWSRCGEQAGEQRVISFEGWGRGVVKVPVDEASRVRWSNSAVMLAYIRSLSGDIRMLNAVAAHLKRCNWLPVRVQSRGIVNALSNVCMPDFTTTDQHCYRGIGSLLRITAGNGSIAEMFRALFHYVTGINPRRELPQEIVIVEDQPWVPWESPCFKQARLAQWFALHPPCLARQNELPLVPGATMTLRTFLHPGELAGGVGHVHVRVKGIEYIVVLGAQVPEDEIVMVAPSRTKRNVFDVPEDIKQLAIQETRRRVLMPKHCKHATLRKPVQFVDGKWHLDGIPWLEWVEQGLESKFVVHPRWDPFASSLEEEDKIIAEALQHRGNGLVEGAHELVQKYCKRMPVDVLQRLMDTMQQATVSTVSLPVPGMDGGLAPGALKAPALQDARVYRSMVLLSRLVPGAMRACKLPQFKILNSVLFHHLCEWVRGVYVVAIALSDEQPNQQSRVNWAATVQGNSAKLYPFQQKSVAKMQLASPDASHFLFASTGSGKTLMAAEQMRLTALRLAVVHSVLWIAPKKLVDGTVKLLSEWGYPVNRVVCKKRKRQESYDFEVKPGMYNVVDVDYLRKIVDDMLPLVSRLIVVVDEVDQCYGTTKRTASAFRVANTAMSVLVMTATAIRKDSDPLAAWLDLTEPFPVNSSNYLASMAKAVNLELDLGITKIKEEIGISMQPEVRQWCFKNPRDWRGMESAVREATDPTLVDVTVEECRRPTTVHTPIKEGVYHPTTVPSGALLVAWNQDHVDKLVGMLNARGVRAGGFEERDDPCLEVLVVVCRNARGYNSAIRFGCMVTGVYPGNAADRQQMEGRLSRIGQLRRELRLVTVVMKGSILDVLLQNQLLAGNTNSSIQALGEKYGSEILKIAAQ